MVFCYQNCSDVLTLLGGRGNLSNAATPTISSSFHTIIVVINHKKIHLDESNVPKSFNNLCLKGISQSQKYLGLPRKGLIIGLVDNFGTKRDILIYIFVIEHHNYGVE